MSKLHDRAEAIVSDDDARPVSSIAFFEEIVRRYRRRIILTAYRITHNIDDARDVTQHVFLQLFLKGPDFADPRLVERWIYVVTRNEALTVARRRGRDNAAETHETDQRPQLDLAETVVRAELSQAVRAVIAQLPSADRRVLELRHLQSVPTAEIASQLGVPVKRVKQDVERAKQRLRIELRRSGLDRELV